MRRCLTHSTHSPLESRLALWPRLHVIGNFSRWFALINFCKWLLSQRRKKGWITFANFNQPNLHRFRKIRATTFSRPFISRFFGFYPLQSPLI